MPANIETMFYTRVAPWHGLGTCVERSLTSQDALEKSGLDWTVTSRHIFTDAQAPIPGYRANVRQSDNRILGIVSDRYKIVQNHEAFQFVDALLGEGVTFETAGSLQNGRKVWMLAKLPEAYTMLEDEITPYLVFSNSHDGSSSIRVACTPIRVVCQNTLNLALSSAKRMWATVHVGDLSQKMQQAQDTLLFARHYMGKLDTEFNQLSQIHLADNKIVEYISLLIPMDDAPTDIHRKNVNTLREDLRIRYFDAPDLYHVNKLHT